MENWRILTPMATSAIASAFCPTKSSAGVEVPSRPPAFVFGIVWPILYLILGITWHRLRLVPNIDFLYGLTSLILPGWLILYNCYQDKLLAYYWIVLVLGLAIFLQIYVTTIDFNSGLALVPYVTWLLLATGLSYYGVNFGDLP